MHLVRSFTVVLVVLMIGCLFFAGFVAPYAADQQNRDKAFAPPTRVHFIDDSHRLTRPFVYGIVEAPPGRGTYTEDRGARFRIQFFPGQNSFGSAAMDRSVHLFGVEYPGAIFLMGTDEFGRDLFSRVLLGGRQSLLISLCAAAVALCFGLLLGSIAGHFGGWTDEILMAVVELFLCIPWLYLLFAVRAALPLRLRQEQAVAAIILLLALVGWARPARLVRGVVLSARELDYVRAARGFGASEWYLLRRHVLSSALPVTVVQGLLLVPGYILAEAALSFAGLGISEPAVSWGSLLIPLQHYDVMVSFWWIWLPAISLILVTGCFYCLTTLLQQRWAQRYR